MRAAALGAVALAAVWLALWATGPHATTSAPLPGAGSGADDFALRIGGAPRRADATQSIAVYPLQRPPAPAMPERVRHDAETAKAVWGAPATFAPPDE